MTIHTVWLKCIVIKFTFIKLLPHLLLSLFLKFLNAFIFAWKLKKLDKIWLLIVKLYRKTHYYNISIKRKILLNEIQYKLCSNFDSAQVLNYILNNGLGLQTRNNSQVSNYYTKQATKYLHRIISNY